MTLDETPEANAVAKVIADRCQGNRKPGQAPTRYATIYQAARLGAIEADAQQREKVERYEAALREISVLVERAFLGGLAAPMALDAIDDVAKAAINPPALHIET